MGMEDLTKEPQQLFAGSSFTGILQDVYKPLGSEPFTSKNEDLARFCFEAEFNEPDGRRVCSMSLLKLPLVFPGQEIHSGGEVSSPSQERHLPLLPSNQSHPGKYNFALEFEDNAQNLAKSAKWVYSKKLNKLFVQRNSPCPVRFKTEAPPPPGSFVRALLVYSKVEYGSEVVARCPAHVLKNAEGYKHPSHILQSLNEVALYETCPKSGRLSLKLPFRQPQAGTDFFSELLVFGCFSSCNGGPNRRPLQILFYLESEEGQTLGRQKVDVKICASPGRDFKLAEGYQCISAVNSKEKEPANVCDRDEVIVSSTDSEGRTSVKIDRRPHLLPESKRMEGSTSFTVDWQKLSVKQKVPEEDSFFVLTVRGKEDFMILSKIKESLELVHKLDPEYIKNCQTSSPPSGPVNDVVHHLQSYAERINFSNKRKRTTTEDDETGVKRCKIFAADMNDDVAPNFALPTDLKSKARIPDGATSTSTCSLPSYGFFPHNTNKDVRVDFERCTVKRTLSNEKLVRGGNSLSHNRQNFIRVDSESSQEQ